MTKVFGCILLFELYLFGTKHLLDMLRSIVLLIMIIVPVLGHASKGGFPADILDANVALVFNNITATATEEAMEDIYKELIHMGFNIVSADVVSNSKEDIEELNLDHCNKKVKYLIGVLCIQMTFPVYRTVIDDKVNCKDRNFEFNPPELLWRLKDPSYMLVINRLKKKLGRWKKHYPASNRTSYDTTLVSGRLLTAEQKQQLHEVREKRTIRYVINADFNTLPDDLKDHELAIVKIPKGATPMHWYVNERITTRMIKYPHRYTFHKSYEDYRKYCGTVPCKYRLILVEGKAIFAPSEGAKERNRSLESQNKTAANPTVFGKSRTVYVAKSFFEIVLRDETNGKIYKVGESNFIGKSMKDFVDMAHRMR